MLRNERRPSFLKLSTGIGLVLIAMACRDHSAPPIPVASITLSLDSAELLVGDSLRLTATVRDEAGAVVTDRAITWSSSSPTVATVHTPGIVRAVARGETRISATTEGISADTLIRTTLPEMVADTIRGDTATAVEAGQTTTVTIPAGALLPGTSVRVEELDSPSDAAGRTLIGSSVHLTVEPPATLTSGQSRASSDSAGLATMAVQLTTDAVSDLSLLRGWLRASVKTAASLDYFFAPDRILTRTTLSGKSVLDLFFDVSLPRTGGNVVLSVTDVTLVCGGQSGFLYTPGYGKAPPGPADDAKTPLVLVHGWQWRNTTCESFANDWWPEDSTWSDLIDLVNQDPTLSKTYQIWLFKYPTVQNISVSARQLRQQFDAHIGKPSVIVGHSMGGVVAAYAIVNDSASQALLDSHLLTTGSPLAGTPLATLDLGGLVQDPTYYECAALAGTVELFARGTLYMDDGPGIRDLAPNSSTIQFLQGRLGNIADKISTWGGDLSLTDLPPLFALGTLSDKVEALGSCALRALGVPDNDGVVGVASSRSILGSSPGTTVAGASHEKLKSAKVLEQTVIPRLLSLSGNIRNPGFEDGLNYWNAYQYPSGWTSSSDNPHAGEHDAVFDFPGGPGYYDASIRTSSTYTIPVEAGVPYLFSFWMREQDAHDTYDALKTILDYSVRVNGTGYGGPTPAPSASWQFVSTVLTFAENGNATIDFQLHGYATSASAQFALDDVSLSALSVTVQSVSVSPAKATVDVGGTQQFVATVKDADGNTLADPTVTWSSSDNSVATVDVSTGVAKGVAAGAAEIRATSEGTSGSATLTVSAPPTILPAPTLRAPANGATGVTNTTPFSWTVVTGAELYHVAFAKAMSDLPANRDTPCIPYTANCWFDVVSGGGPSVVSVNLNESFEPGTKYFWRVQAVSGDVPGNWSAIWSFTTAN